MDELQIDTELLRTEMVRSQTTYVYRSPWTFERVNELMDEALPGDLKVQAHLDGEYREFIVLSQVDDQLRLALT